MGEYAERRDYFLKYNREYRVKRKDDPVRLQTLRGASLRWYHRNREKVRDRQMRAWYGIGLEEYAAMLSNQGGVCKICHKPPSGKHRNGEPAILHVDHCEETGKVRGLLCKECNMGLGLLNHNQELLTRAIQYLSEG